MKMTAPKQSLKSLTFTVLPKIEANPVQERRTKTIARLEEQKQLFSDLNYTRTVRTSVKNDDGVRTIVEKQQRILPWWVKMSDGSYLFTIKSGWKPIEFDKGKSAIVVLSPDKLPAIIDTLIAAVRNGELTKPRAVRLGPEMNPPHHAHDQAALRFLPAVFFTSFLSIAAVRRPASSLLNRSIRIAFGTAFLQTTKARIELKYGSIFRPIVLIQRMRKTICRRIVLRHSNLFIRLIDNALHIVF
jgi:hypothetical protein